MTHDRIWSGRIGVLALNLRRQMTILSGTCVVLRVTRVVGPENPKGTLEMLSSDEAPEVIGAHLMNKKRNPRTAVDKSQNN